MQLFVAKNGQQLGPFEEAKVREMLAAGSIAGTDLGWHAALPGWAPLNTILVDIPPVLPVGSPSAPALNPAYAPAGGFASPGLTSYGGKDLAAGSHAPLAGRGERFLAALIDGVLFGVVYVPALILNVLDGHSGENNSMGPLGIIGVGISGLLFLALLVVQIIGISTRGQTIGKRLMGVRIVRMSGAPAGFVNGFLLRSVVGSLPSLIPFLGSVYALVDACFIFAENRRCLHDLIADTHVVNAKV